MKLRLVSLALVFALISMLVFAPTSTTKAQGPAAAIPVTGTFTDALGGTGTFAGMLDITRFTTQNGQLAAVGTLTGTLTDSLGNILGTVTQAVTLLVDTAQGSCQILHLELGPLDLDLLGLQVHLDQVVLDITAQAGPGNLLGNLLCAVAHLLDSNGVATALANLLNQILRAL
jgi:hypothetical protein